MASKPAAKGSFSKAKERPSDKHPLYKGSITFNEDIPAGTKLWLSGWLNESDDGQYVSIQLQFPLEKGGTGGGYTARPPTRPAARTSSMDDEIPF